MTPVIAIVHTDHAVVTLLTSLLEDDGYRPIAHTEPYTARDLIIRTSPDLVIIELGFGLSLPSWTLVDRLRSDPQTRHIPIIALTTSPDLEAARPESCRENLEILPEPFEIDHVLGMIRSMLKQPGNYRCG